MPFQLIRVAPDPNTPPFSFMEWISGAKTYISLAMTAAKFWFVVVYGHPWSDAVDMAIDASLVALVGGSVRSAWKTHTAQIVNSNVRPTSPAAIGQANTVPEPEAPKEVPKP